MTPKELRAKAAMLLEHGGVRREPAKVLIDSLLELPERGALPDLEALLCDRR